MHNHFLFLWSQGAIRKVDDSQLVLVSWMIFCDSVCHQQFNVIRPHGWSHFNVSVPLLFLKWSCKHLLQNYMKLVRIWQISIAAWRTCVYLRLRCRTFPCILQFLVQGTWLRLSLSAKKNKNNMALKFRTMGHSNQENRSSGCKSFVLFYQVYPHLPIFSFFSCNLFL